MTITLPAELNEFLQTEVTAGRYRSVGDAVCETVQLLRESTDPKELLRKLDEGLAQLERGEEIVMNSVEAEDQFFAELKSGIAVPQTHE